VYYQSKGYCPVLVVQQGSALWGNTLATALLHDQNQTIPLGLIVQISSEVLPMCYPLKIIFLKITITVYTASLFTSSSVRIGRGRGRGLTYGATGFAEGDGHHGADEARGGGQHLRLGGLPPREARSQQDGEVPDLVRDLVDQNGERRQHPDPERDQEAAPDRKAVREVVDAVRHQIQIARHLRNQFN